MNWSEIQVKTWQQGSYRTYWGAYSALQTTLLYFRIGRDGD